MDEDSDADQRPTGKGKGKGKLSDGVCVIWKTSSSLLTRVYRK